MILIQTVGEVKEKKKDPRYNMLHSCSIFSCSVYSLKSIWLTATQ